MNGIRKGVSGDVEDHKETYSKIKKYACLCQCECIFGLFLYGGLKTFKFQIPGISVGSRNFSGFQELLQLRKLGRKCEIFYILQY